MITNSCATQFKIWFCIGSEKAFCLDVVFGSVADPDTHHFGKLEPYPHQVKCLILIWIRIKVESRIRIRSRIKVKRLKP
jgi:hypothetical protein